MNTFEKVASRGKLTLGLVFPIEAYSGSVAKMKNQEALAQKAEELGFRALWFRDVPFNDPSFGDAGQLYDPWIYMTHIMNQTKQIALATGSIILPLRHPVHTAKSVNSLQLISNERLLLGIASGDRPSEYPAFNRDLSQKSELFRDSFHYVKALLSDFPEYESSYFGSTNGTIDLLPKYSKQTPMFVTGHSGQSLEWIAKHGDGWIYYPRDITTLQAIMGQWKAALSSVGVNWKPFIQSLYVDIFSDKQARPRPIHLGFSSNTSYLKAHLNLLRSHGVNHVILNLKYGSRPAEEVMEEIGRDILPYFQ